MVSVIWIRDFVVTPTFNSVNCEDNIINREYLPCSTFFVLYQTAVCITSYKFSVFFTASFKSQVFWWKIFKSVFFNLNNTKYYFVHTTGVKYCVCHLIFYEGHKYPCQFK